MGVIWTISLSSAARSSKDTRMRPLVVTAKAPGKVFVLIPGIVQIPFPSVPPGPKVATRPGAAKSMARTSRVTSSRGELANDRA